MDSPLVTTEWLHEHLNDSDLLIIDMRGKVLPPTEPPPHYLTDREGYMSGHIPNAVFVDWQIDIVEPASPSNDIASPERFAELMGGLGVDDSIRVIVYDNAASMFAARLRWCLLYYGHDKVGILDGGWQKWIEESRPVNSQGPGIAPRTFVPRTTASLKASADEILSGMTKGSIQLIDVRSPAEFAGSASRAQFGGHIPSAANLPWKTMVADDMTLKPQSELREHIEEAGIHIDAEDTVLYCNSGVSACHGMLALEVAGARNLRIYDGSWKEWGNDPSKPIARLD